MMSIFPRVDSFMNLKVAGRDRLRIYVAGPYTNGDVVINVRRAIAAADYITYKLGHIAFCPHLIHLWHMVIPHSVDFWYEYDLEWLKVCDAILRLDGESKGANRKVKWADDHGLTIFYDLYQIPKAGEA